MTTHRWIAPFLSAFALLSLISSASAVSPPGVNDKARLFSAPVRKQANQEIQALKDKYGLALVIETAPTLRYLSWKIWEHKDFKSPNLEARAAAFARLAKTRAQEKAGPVAVYVLACAEPAPVNVQVVVGSKVGEAFPTDYADRLAQILREGLTGTDHDAALRNGVNFFRTSLEQNPAATVIQTAGFDWMLIVWCVVPFLAVWAVAAAIRPAPAGSPHAVAYGGAGSYLAGLFATMTSCEYRQMFRFDAAGPAPQPCNAAVAEVRVEPMPADGAVVDTHEGPYNIDHYPDDRPGPASVAGQQTGAPGGSMSSTDCPYCRRVAAANSDPDLVAHLPHSVVLLGPWQYYHGYCIVVARRHATELSGLDDAERCGYLDDMCRVARAIEDCFQPHKLNYELLGNQVPHLHWHLFPRSADDPDRLQPVWLALDRAERDEGLRRRLQTGPRERVATLAALRDALANPTEQNH